MTTIELQTESSSVTPDQHILAALERFRIARKTYNELPIVELCGAYESPEEEAAGEAMDAAEGEIRQAVAVTPFGVEVKLWMALRGCQQWQDERDDQAAIACDLDHFVSKESSFDWPIRMLISAIVSLRGMAGEKVA